MPHRAILGLKKLVYASRGEPYRIDGIELRYAPGTRPVRVKYRASPNAVSRYDALQIEFIARVLKVGSFAVDIGAHAGQYALIMAAKCGSSGKVIAFEPDYHARNKFFHNIALNPALPKIRVEPIALLDRSGASILYSRGGDSNSSLNLSGLPETEPAVLEKIEVEMATLDVYLDQNGLGCPDLVKIDAEGAEIRILHGAEAVLASDAAIICELHPYAWHGFGTELEDLRALCVRSGRRLRYLDQTSAFAGDAVYGTVALER